MTSLGLTEKVHNQGEDLQRVTQTADPLYRLGRGTHIIIDDGAQTTHAWDGDGDQLESVTGQLYG